MWAGIKSTWTRSATLIAFLALFVVVALWHTGAIHAGSWTTYILTALATVCAGTSRFNAPARTIKAMFHHFTNALSSEALGRPPALVAPGTRSDWQPPRRIPAPQDEGDERQDQASSDADGSSPPNTEGPNLIDAALNFRPITSASKNPRGGPPPHHNAFEQEPEWRPILHSPVEHNLDWQLSAPRRFAGHQTNPPAGSTPRRRGDEGYRSADESRRS